MKTTPYSQSLIRLAAAALSSLLLLTAVQTPSLAANPSISAEVGQPLQAAQKALQAKQYKEAQAQIQRAEGVAKRTPYESYLIARLKSSSSGRTRIRPSG